MSDHPGPTRDRWGREVDAPTPAFFAALVDRWFRVEWEGLEHVPRQGGADAQSVPRAVLTPRVEAEQKRVQPFPPPPPQYLMPAQYLQPPPPPPLPEPEDFGQVDEPITAADARLVRLFAETIRAMGQEHACV